MRPLYFKETESKGIQHAEAGVFPFPLIAIIFMYAATFISRVSDTCPISSLIAIGGVRTIKTRQTLRRIIFVPLKPSFTRSFYVQHKQDACLNRQTT